MLYLSTRNKTDSFTSYRALHCETAPDGGLFAPLRLRPFEKEEIHKYLQMSFGEAVSSVLNHFFSAQLTGWDVDFCIGRSPVKLESAGYKTVVAELWHNHAGKYSVMKNTLYSRLCGSTKEIPEWASIAIDIAVLFGVYTQISKNEDPCMDIAIPEESAGTIAAAWYAKRMGLPIGKILCVCSENSPLWDFILHGELNTSAMKSQGIAPQLAERLVYDVYGLEETEAYLKCVASATYYRISEEILSNLNEELYATAVGKNRAESVQSSVLRSSGYSISRDAAVSFGGLQDYRSRTGESRNTLLLSTQKAAD